MGRFKGVLQTLYPSTITVDTHNITGTEDQLSQGDVTTSIAGGEYNDVIFEIYVPANVSGVLKFLSSMGGYSMNGEAPKIDFTAVVSKSNRYAEIGIKNYSSTEIIDSSTGLIILSEATDKVYLIEVNIDYSHLYALKVETLVGGVISARVIGVNS